MRTLVEAHGDDVVAMTRDLKRNAMQHTAGVRAHCSRASCAGSSGAEMPAPLAAQKLRVLLASYHAYAGKDGGRHEFRAPKKRL